MKENFMSTYCTSNDVSAFFTFCSKCLKIHERLNSMEDEPQILDFSDFIKKSYTAVDDAVSNVEGLGGISKK